jgi:hypothetical protein
MPANADQFPQTAGVFRRDRALASAAHDNFDYGVPA